MPTQYTKKDAAKDTKESTKEVSRVWHDARDTARKSGDLPSKGRGSGNKGSGSNKK